MSQQVEQITLDDLYERTIADYEARDAIVHRNEFTDNLPQNPLRGIARSFQDLSGDGADYVFVYAGGWRNEHVLAFANTALRLGDSDSVGRLLLVSALPVPEPVAYLFSKEPRSRFALNALARFGNRAVTLEDASGTATEGRELVEQIFQIELQSGRDGLEQLDDLILRSLRTVEDPEADQPGYVPDVALELVGLLAGHMMIEAAAQDGDLGAEWVDPGRDMPGRKLAVKLERGSKWSLLNPLGKALKVFQNGSGDSLRFMYDGSVAMLRGGS